MESIFRNKKNIADFDAVLPSSGLYVISALEMINNECLHYTGIDETRVSKDIYVILSLIIASGVKQNF